MNRRLSRKRKKWLRRWHPLGACTDKTGHQGVAGVRHSFIAERGHSKRLWADLWAIWAPQPMEGAEKFRFNVTESWFAAFQRPQLPSPRTDN
jgi:hypothetical protein